MRYVVLYTDGTFCFFVNKPRKENFVLDVTVFMVSSIATVNHITDWIANDYKHPLFKEIELED